MITLKFEKNISKSDLKIITKRFFLEGNPDSWRKGLSQRCLLHKKESILICAKNKTVYINGRYFYSDKNVLQFKKELKDDELKRYKLQLSISNAIKTDLKNKLLEKEQDKLLDGNQLYQTMRTILE